MESKVLYRTFIAIPVELPDHLEELTASLKQKFSHERIRWIVPEQMHITLKFLGDITPEQTASICEQFKASYRDIASDTFTLKGLGTFSHRSELKVLWSGIQDAAPIHQLHAATENMLSRLLVIEDESVYRPHLTLARIKRLKHPEPFMREVRRYTEEVFGTCVLSKVIFYRSILGPNGAKHEALEEVTLS